jgi:hypothetical protein
MSLLETSGKERQEKIKERVNKQTRVEVSYQGGSRKTSFAKQ